MRTSPTKEASGLLKLQPSQLFDKQAGRDSLAFAELVVLGTKNEKKAPCVARRQVLKK